MVPVGVSLANTISLYLYIYLPLICVYRFYNCRILKDHKIITDNFYVRDGIIINPEKLFFEEKISPDVHINCKNAIICPGFIDIQINGKYIYRYRDIVLANETPTGTIKIKHTCSKQQ
jgi:N-acetylglucosamine-6-phosphate deacetylase